MLYELRIYHCLPGRLPALLKRFETVTLGLFEKHGIRQAGFWTVQIGEGNNDLHYLLAWELLAEREKTGRRSRPIRHGTRRGRKASAHGRSSARSRT